jgi:uncharacterized membrane protein
MCRVWTLSDWHGSLGPYLLAAGALYLLGALSLTIAYHAPRTNRLAALRPESLEAAHVWTSYLNQWTSFTHVRAAAAAAASVTLTLATVM